MAFAYLVYKTIPLKFRKPVIDIACQLFVRKPRAFDTWHYGSDFFSHPDVDLRVSRQMFQNLGFGRHSLQLDLTNRVSIDYELNVAAWMVGEFLYFGLNMIPVTVLCLNEQELVVDEH